MDVCDDEKFQEWKIIHKNGSDPCRGQEVMCSGDFLLSQDVLIKGGYFKKELRCSTSNDLYDIHTNWGGVIVVFCCYHGGFL